MKIIDLFSEAAGVGKIVKGVNTTPDVGPNEIKIQAAKFGMKVNKDGYPPVARSDGKITEKRKFKPTDQKLWRHLRYKAKKKFDSKVDAWKWAAEKYKKQGGTWSL